MHCQRDDSGFAHMDVSENGGTPKSSILIGFSIIFTIHFGGNAPIFGNIHMCFAYQYLPPSRSENLLHTSPQERLP